jgi:hypothetical protein
LEAVDSGDDVAYGAEGVEGVVGNLDGEELFDLEGQVDLVEGVDVELFEGGGRGDGVWREGFGFGDEVDDTGCDVGLIAHRRKCI